MQRKCLIRFVWKYMFIIFLEIQDPRVNDRCKRYIVIINITSIYLKILTNDSYYIRIFIRFTKNYIIQMIYWRIL